MVIVDGYVVSAVSLAGEIISSLGLIKQTLIFLNPLMPSWTLRLTVQTELFRI